MARFPDAEQLIIPPGPNDPGIEPCGAILHVDAGNASTLKGWFSGPSGGIESHFHVPKRGRPEQYRDTSREADANYEANSFWRGGRRVGFISIETQGYGDGAWNPHQLREIRALLRWLAHTHDFPLRECPGPFSSGVGYHVMWGAPGPWTPASKSCPGPDRIRQFTDDIVPWMRGGHTESDDIMAMFDNKRELENFLRGIVRDEVDRIDERTWNGQHIPGDNADTANKRIQPRWAMRRILNRIDATHKDATDDQVNTNAPERIETRENGRKLDRVLELLQGRPS